MANSKTARGGLVETSGHQIEFADSLNVKAGGKTKGTWLIDPDYIDIVNGTDRNSWDRLGTGGTFKRLGYGEAFPYYELSENSEGNKVTITDSKISSWLSQNTERMITLKAKKAINVTDAIVTKTGSGDAALWLWANTISDKRVTGGSVTIKNSRFTNLTGFEIEAYSVTTNNFTLTVNTPHNITNGDHDRYLRDHRNWYRRGGMYIKAYGPTADFINSSFTFGNTFYGIIDAQNATVNLNNVTIGLANQELTRSNGMAYWASESYLDIKARGITANKFYGFAVDWNASQTIDISESKFVATYSRKNNLTAGADLFFRTSTTDGISATSRGGEVHVESSTIKERNNFDSSKVNNNHS